MMRLIKYVELKEILSFLTRDIYLLVLEFQNRNKSPFFLPFVCHLFENVSMSPKYTLEKDLKLQN